MLFPLYVMLKNKFMKYKFLIVIFILFFGKTFSQTTEKITFIDSQNYYYESIPKGNPVGIIFILPGGDKTAKRVKNSIFLDDLATAR